MYQRIMVPLDGSELAECVLPHVEALTKGGGVQEVTFVRVADTFHSAPMGGEAFFTEGEIKRYDKDSYSVAKNYLDQVIGKVNYGKVNVKSKVLTGRAAENLADYANKNKVDLVIIATHGRSGVSRWVWGSVADRILHSSNAPVLMVRPPGCEPGA